MVIKNEIVVLLMEALFGWVLKIRFIYIQVSVVCVSVLSLLNLVCSI